MRILANFYSYTSGHVGSLAWIEPTEVIQIGVEESTEEALRAKIGLEMRNETDPFFTGIELSGNVSDLAEAAREQDWRRRNYAKVIIDHSRNIDRLISELYGVPLDYRAFERDYHVNVNDLARSTLRGEYQAGDLARDLVSIGIGCSFGRWHSDIVVGELQAPDAASAFQPLRAWAPAQREGHIADITTSSPSDAVQPRRILVDDPSSPDDVIRLVVDWIASQWADDDLPIENRIQTALGVRRIREYISKPTGFFSDHLMRYSQSRRQAPIYWPISTESGSFTIWLYYPRLTSDTIYTAANNYLNPKIATVDRSISEIGQSIASASGGAATRLQRDLESEQELRRELIDMRDELLRIAALPYRPNLDDGVIINAAPFHRLFRHRAWAKATEDIWKKLEQGEYDWAHLAYAIWPDRVRDVCRSDKSIAIAHGLEALYVEAPAAAKKGKGRARQRALTEEDA